MGRTLIRPRPGLEATAQWGVGEQREPITPPVITEATQRAWAQGGDPSLMGKEDHRTLQGGGPPALGLSAQGLDEPPAGWEGTEPAWQNLCSRPRPGRSREGGSGKAG